MIDNTRIKVCEEITRLVQELRNIADKLDRVELLISTSR